MSEAKTEIWQGLMDAAYERWNAEGGSGSKTYDQMLADCSALERRALLLGNLNYQVGNGGFVQWVDNGYGLKAREAVDALRWVGGERAEAVAKMIERLIPHIDFDKTARGWDDYWLREDRPAPAWDACDCDADEDEPCAGEVICEELDGPYYELADAGLLADIEAAFEKAVAA